MSNAKTPREAHGEAVGPLSYASASEGAAGRKVSVATWVCLLAGLALVSSPALIIQALRLTSAQGLERLVTPLEEFFPRLIAVRIVSGLILAVLPLGGMILALLARRKTKGVGGWQGNTCRAVAWFPIVVGVAFVLVFVLSLFLFG